MERDEGLGMPHHFLRVLPSSSFLVVGYTHGGGGVTEALSDAPADMLSVPRQIPPPLGLSFPS